MTKAEIMTALTNTNQEIQKYFSDIPKEIFFTGSNEAWSPAHHLAHLVQSNLPVAMALAAPELLTKLTTDKPSSQHRNYSELKAVYQEALKNGARATGRFVPTNVDATTQPEALMRFAETSHNLFKAIDQWQETEFDQYALPHPVLGQLSMREMLFFTDFHNQHHLEGVRKKIV